MVGDQGQAQAGHGALAGGVHHVQAGLPGAQVRAQAAAIVVAREDHDRDPPCGLSQEREALPHGLGRRSGAVEDIARVHHEVDLLPQGGAEGGREGVAVVPGPGPALGRPPGAPRDAEVGVAEEEDAHGCMMAPELSEVRTDDVRARGSGGGGRAGYAGGVLVLISALLAAPVLAAPAVDAVDAAVLRAALEEFNAHAVWTLPELEAAQLEALLAGEVVRWVDRPEGPEGPRRAAALVLAEASRELMWLAAQDLHFQGDPSVHEVRLALRPPDDADWYGYLDLPGPFADRHWLVRSWNNHDLARATEGRAWEHPWRHLEGELEPLLVEVRARAAAGELGPVDAERVDKAVLSPSNHGAFVAISLPDGRTLFGYHAVFQAGGYIPDWAVTQWAYGGLEKAMRRFEHRATELIPGHYGPDHADVIGGDGRRVRLVGSSEGG